MQDIINISNKNETIVPDGYPNATKYIKMERYGNLAKLLENQKDINESLKRIIEDLKADISQLKIENSKLKAQKK